MNQYTPDNGPDYPWVRIEDGLPESERNLLAIVEHARNKNRFVDKALVYNGHWYLGDGSSLLDIGYRVTHWQYLPRLPNLTT